jgi:predicted nuclease with TOPRIM domain
MSNLNHIKGELDYLEKRLQQLELEKQALQEQLRKEEELQAKLDEVVEQSGYNSARDLAMALVRKYNLRINDAVASKASMGETKERKPRVRMTAELRDTIRQEVAEGKKKMAIARDHNISYTLVNLVFKGRYDHL